MLEGTFAKMQLTTLLELPVIAQNLPGAVEHLLQCLTNHTSDGPIFWIWLYIVPKDSKLPWYFTKYGLCGSLAHGSCAIPLPQHSHFER